MLEPLKTAMVAIALGLTGAAQAQPSADQILTEMGFSGAEKQRVLTGEFVTAEIGAVSERDLSYAVAFLVKTSPAALTKDALEGGFFVDDAEVRASGTLSVPGRLKDLSGLRITTEEAQALSSASHPVRTNLSAAEQDAFKTLSGGTVRAVEEQLRKTLLARYQSYRAAGLGGIAPYDHGGGDIVDVASDLTKAGRSAAPVQKHLPALYAFLVHGRGAALPGFREKFLWVRSIIRDEPTYVLAHMFAVSDGEARAVVRREFYVSTGYNAQQTIVGFLPVADGTVVLCMSHAFTDQVAGAGGSLMRGIGSRIMASHMKQVFDRSRKRIER